MYNMTNSKATRKRWHVTRNGFSVSTLVLFIALASTYRADASINDVLGGRCFTSGEKVTIGKHLAKCTKVGNKLVWTKVPATKTPVPSAKKGCSIEGKVRLIAQGSKSGVVQQCARNAAGKLTWLRVDYYTGPKVVNGLPFTRSLPTGSPLDVAQAFARDATNLLNCEYGLFDRCAISVWGRRDPWMLTQEGKDAAFDAPWVALWSKYNAVGVEIWQRNGPYTAVYPNGVPTLDLYYRLTIGGQVFRLSLRENPPSVPSDPNSWYVPGCPFCFAYEVKDS